MAPARFADKSVLITGASSGIGAALARRFALDGATCGLFARRRDRLEELATDLPGTGHCVIPGDVTNLVSCQAGVEAFVAQTGGIDLLINNAGISMNARFEDADPVVFRQVMEVNYLGAVNMTHCSFRHLLERHGGIVFMSSVGGKRGLPARSGYSASKFALHGLFESLRAELLDRDIYVGIMCPAFVASEIRQNALAGDGTVTPRSGQTYGAVMTAEELAEMVLRAVVSRKRELIPTFGGRMLTWLNRFLPRMTDRLANKITR